MIASILHADPRRPSHSAATKLAVAKVAFEFTGDSPPTRPSVSVPKVEELSDKHLKKRRLSSSDSDVTAVPTTEVLTLTRENRDLLCMIDLLKKRVETLEKEKAEWKKPQVDAAVSKTIEQLTAAPLRKTLQVNRLTFKDVAMLKPSPTAKVVLKKSPAAAQSVVKTAVPVEVIKEKAPSHKSRSKLQVVTREEFMNIKNGLPPKTTKYSPMKYLYFTGVKKNQISLVKASLAFCQVRVSAVRNIGFIGRSVMQLLTFEDYAIELIEKMTANSYIHLPDFDPLSVEAFKAVGGSEVLAVGKYCKKQKDCLARLPTHESYNRLRNFLQKEVVSLEDLLVKNSLPVENPVC
jgi:BMFP domain-containing protein YqiC